jgi:hypothetical protein
MHILEHGNTKEKNMNSLGWLPLQERRSKIKVTMLYKIKNELVLANKDDLIQSSSPRRPLNFFIPQSKKNCHLHSFFPSTIRLWNSIPDNIKATNSLSQFKSAIENHTLTCTY